MSKVKYRVREYNPTSAQQGSHSFFAEAVINNEITNSELAEKIAARTGVKAYEVTTVIAAIADIISEEVLESNRISLADYTGTKMVSIYPKAQGSVTDEDIRKATNGQRTVATADDLTADMIQWSLGATVGIKFSKQFSLQKSAKRVGASEESTGLSQDEGDQGNQGDGNGGNGGNGGENQGGEGWE